jgi:hypothetical protein
MKAEIKGNNLILTLPLTPPVASASGKTLVVASTKGNKETDVTVEYKGEQRNIVVGVNAYIYPTAK